jgi:hypothetical protein
MGSVRDLITAALLDLGALASGEAPTATEAADALRRLNLLLETWRLESLMVSAVDTVSKVLTGATSYTLGPGGDINTTRPVRLEHAVHRQGSGASALDFPLAVLTDVQYEQLGLKGLQSGIARWLYLDRAYPLATLVTYPVLPAGDTLVLYPWHPLTAFASLDTTVALPPGYELALQTNLSLELVSMFRDCTVTPALAAQAIRSKALIKTINAQPRLLQLPAGLPTGRRGGGGTSRAGFLSGGNT